MRYAQQIIFNFGKFSGKIRTDGSICGFMIAPNATVAMNSTSSGRIVARNYESNSGEWHFTGTYPGTGYEYNPEEEHSVEYSISMMEGKRENCFVVLKKSASLTPAEASESRFIVTPTKSTSYSLTPSERKSTTYYIVPKQDSIEIYEAKIDAQYYKTKKYEKKVTQTSKKSEK